MGTEISLTIKEATLDWSKNSLGYDHGKLSSHLISMSGHPLYKNLNTTGMTKTIYIVMMEYCTVLALDAN